MPPERGRACGHNVFVLATEGSAVSRNVDGLEALLDALAAAGWQVADRHRERLLRMTPPREVHLEHGRTAGRLRVDPLSADDLLADLWFMNPLDPGLPGSTTTDGLRGRLSATHAQVVEESVTGGTLEGIEDPATIARGRLPTSSTPDELETFAADLTTVAEETTALHDAVLRTVSTWDPTE